MALLVNKSGAVNALVLRDHVVLAASGVDFTETGPAQPNAFEMSVKLRRSGGRTWGDQARLEGGGRNAISDVTPIEKGL